MILIWIYSNGILERCNIYDDRGFVSKTVIYENGECVYQDYLMENGIRKLRLFVDGHVEINENCPLYNIPVNSEIRRFPFEKLRYDSLGDVVAEVFRKYVAQLSYFDIFCVATHPNHNQIIAGVLSTKKTILSFFGDRLEKTIDKDTEKLIMKSRYVITDVKATTTVIRPYAEKYHVPLMEISPYDSRPDFGISQQLSKQQILLPVDDLNKEDFSEIVMVLDRYLSENEYASVNFFTRIAGYGRKEEILNEAFELISHVENKSRFMVEQCIDEPSVTGCVKKQRLIVNLSNTPELYLQIAALSAGIPQIVKVRTQYVKHKRNGMIIRKLSELHDALGFYLNGLSNWNNAMINSYDLGREYSTEVLISNWKEVIKSVGHSKGAYIKR